MKHFGFFLASCVTLLNLAQSSGQENTDKHSEAESQFQFDLEGLSDWIKSQARHEKTTALRLRKLMLTALNYESSYQEFPFDWTRDPKLPGWRPLLLKTLGNSARSIQSGDKLITELDDIIGDNEYTVLDREVMYFQPWDSNFNKLLETRMPEIFGLDNKPDVFAIDNRVTTMGSVSDGTDNTIALIHLPPQEVNWMKRNPIHPEQVVEIVKGLRDGEHLLVVFFNGRVARITNSVEENTFRNLLNRSDGQQIESWKLDYANLLPSRKATANADHEKVTAMIQTGEFQRCLDVLTKTPSADKETDIKTSFLFVEVYQAMLKMGSDAQDEQKQRMEHAGWSQGVRHNLWKIRRLDPDNLQALRLSAETEFESRKYFIALQAYKLLLDSDPAVFRRIYELNRLVRNAQENPAMLEQAERMLRDKQAEQADDFGSWRSTITDLADCLMLQESVDEGIEYLGLLLTRQSGKQEYELALKAELSRLYAERASRLGSSALPDAGTKQLADLARAYEYDRTNLYALRQLTELGFNSDTGNAARGIFDPRSERMADLPGRILSLVGQHELANENFKEAIQYLELSITKDWSSPETLHSLAAAFYAMDSELDRALVLVDNAIETATETLRKTARETRPQPMAGREIAPYHLTRSRILDKLGKSEEAGQSLQKAFRIDPMNKAVLMQLIENHQDLKPSQAEKVRRRLELLEQQEKSSREK